MLPVKARITRALPIGAEVEACDNSGAKIIRIFTVKKVKTVRRRIQAAGIGDIVVGSVKRGRPDMRKQVVYAVIVRQKKEYRRPDGMRIKFADNACVVLKDEKGNPKGTLIKGPIPKEVCDRYPAIAKLASIIV